MKKVTANQRINMGDGEVVLPGKPVNGLTDKQVEKLEAAGVVTVEAVNDDSADPPERQALDSEVLAELVQAGEEELQDLVQAVIPSLGEGDFTASEKPKVKAIQVALKGKVDPDLITGDVVSLAWDAYNAAQEAA